MAAPEDPNGLREAACRLGREENDKDAFLRIAERIGIDSEYRWSSDPELRQGSLVELLERHAALIAERDEALSASRLSDRIAKAHADRATAAEAEITRLKEGMEAAPTEAEFKAAEEAVMAEWAIMREQLRAPHINWPVSPTNWRILRAGWTAIAKARATLSPKEQP